MALFALCVTGQVAMDTPHDFSVALDLKYFRLAEISVKLMDNSVVVVEAKHKERPDEEFGSISRHFLHRYRLPSDIDPGSLASNFSENGKGKPPMSKDTDLEGVLMETDCFDASRYIIDNYEHPDSKIFYTLTRLSGKSSPEALFEEFESGCLCEDSECNADKNCSCLTAGSNYARFNGGLVLDKSKFGDVPVFECNFRCSCFKECVKYWNDTREIRKKPVLCPNRWVQFGPSDDLRVFDAGRKGSGLKCDRKIHAGFFICEYAGEVIDLGEAKKREERYSRENEMNYIFVLIEHFESSEKFVTCIDPTSVGNIGRYINHSCEPNAAVVPVRVNNMVPLLCVFALRDIEKGEEICFDYSGSGRGIFVEGADGRSRKPCYCGAESCKKWLPSSNFESI